jgi:hypothetical protein
MMDFEQVHELKFIGFCSFFGEGNKGETGMKAFLKKEKPVWE